jgi:hypothetical protein
VARSIASADDDCDLDPAPLHGRHLGGDRRDPLTVGAVFEIAHQGLARELQQHPLVDGRRTVGAPHAGQPTARS